jgi:hypothetical protein
VIRIAGLDQSVRMKLCKRPSSPGTSLRAADQDRTGIISLEG